GADAIPYRVLRYMRPGQQALHPDYRVLRRRALHFRIVPIRVVHLHALALAYRVTRERRIRAAPVRRGSAARPGALWLRSRGPAERGWRGMAAVLAPADTGWR